MAEFDSLRETLFDSEGQPSGWFFFFLLAFCLLVYGLVTAIKEGLIK